MWKYQAAVTYLITSELYDTAQVMLASREGYELLALTAIYSATEKESRSWRRVIGRRGRLFLI